MAVFSRSFAVTSCLVAVLLVPARALAQEPEEPAQPVPSGDAAEPSATTPEVDETAATADKPEDLDVRQPRQAFRGIFGAAPDTGEARRVANLTVSALGAYDDNGVGDLAHTSDPRLTESGYYADVAAALDYSVRGRRSSFTASGATSVSQYQVLEGALASYSAGVGFSAPVGRNALHASQTVAYSPFYEVGAFATLPSAVPSDVSVPTPDRNLEAAGLQSIGYSTSIDFTRPLSRRSSFGTFYDFRETKFSKEPQYDLGEQRAGVRYLHALTQHATLHLEYAYRSGHYGQLALDQRARHSHDVVVGVNYGRTLSFSRKTKVTFSTGSSLLVGDNSLSPSASADEGNHVFATGDVSLVHTLSRTWLARGTYQRSLRYVEGFTQPFLADAVNANVAGYLGRRVRLNFDSSYSSGSVGPTSVANNYDTFAASAQAHVALNRHWAVFAQSLYYHYSFGPGVVLPVSLVPELDRRGFRIGLTTWLPVIRGKD